ncbi:MAG: hypothetical protein AB7L09_01605 [Nitrospira sp.]
MTVDQFADLKRWFIERAEEALVRLGTSMSPSGPTYFRLPNLLVVRVLDSFTVKRPVWNYLTYQHDLRTVYEFCGGRETPLGFTHRDIVRIYRDVLEDLDRALLLDDLARV